MIKQLFRRLFSAMGVETIFNGNKNIASLSTLQKIESSKKENDLFYLQTQIRLCAHIAQKDFCIPVDKPRYRQFARELAERLHNYKGPNIASIEWAKSILRRYEDKYGL